MLRNLVSLGFFATLDDVFIDLFHIVQIQANLLFGAILQQLLAYLRMACFQESHEGTELVCVQGTVENECNNFENNVLEKVLGDLTFFGHYFYNFNGSCFVQVKVACNQQFLLYLKLALQQE